MGNNIAANKIELYVKIDTTKPQKVKMKKVVNNAKDTICSDLLSK